jgi:hypothetical protein
MTRGEKLIERFYRKPKDFRWDELVSLMNLFGYKLTKQGKTSGSRRKFIHTDGARLYIHEPHPRKILKTFQIEYIYERLEKEGHI